jgi:hypothetical protein
MQIKRSGLAAWLAAVMLATSAQAENSAWDFGGDIGMELRWFPNHPRWPGQSDRADFSLFTNLEFHWSGQQQRISIKPFARLDSVDEERSHVDLREAYWAYEGDGWELLLGADKVFWGVAESRHLVDVINQTDLVEDPDREEKLGQPMIYLSMQRDWGELGLFVMPYFRERTFPGVKGRLRPPLSVDSEAPLYESPAGRHHTDLALRWSHYFGDVDIGLSMFQGTARNPKLVISASGDRLLPYYYQSTQAGIDLQYTRGAWLWKAEAMVRNGLDDRFFAAVAGFEYTVFGVGDSDRDLGLLIEYLYDGRGPSEPVTTLDNDLFIGSRLTWNDAQDSNLLAGVVVDVDEREWFFSLEAERRLGQDYFLKGRLRLFNGDRRINQLFAFDRDDYLQISLTRYF